MSAVATQDLNKCALCGYGYAEGLIGTTCTKCPLNRGCKLSSCPNCGFGAPAIPGWMKKLVHLLKREERYVNEHMAA